MRNVWKKVFSLLLLLAMMLPRGQFADAEIDGSLWDRKGTAPAEGPWLEEGSLAEGAKYENPPADVKIVRIGLCSEAEPAFYNTEGAGFRFGVYDENRQFVERGRTDCSALRIFCAAEEEYGLLVVDGWEEELLYFSGGDSLAIEAISGETGFSGDTFRGGFDCIKTEDWQVTVVNVVPLEDYVKGVLPYEMANDWPMEALKAQAVCARTYVVYNQNGYEEFGFDLTDDTESQVYRGTTYANARTDAAVDATAGELIRYRGEICEIYYFAADGGATEDGRWVFDADRPYLLGKLDPFEQAVSYSYQTWEREFTGEEIVEKLAGKQYSLSPVVALEPKLSAVGNVIAMTYVGQEGDSLRLEGRDCYTVLGLPDCRFTVSVTEDGYLFTGSGLGHSCGMSQWGAKAMDEVYGYDYREIIGFYYTGAYIA